MGEDMSFLWMATIHTTLMISWIMHANMASMYCVILHIPPMYTRVLMSWFSVSSKSVGQRNETRWNGRQVHWYQRQISWLSLVLLMYMHSCLKTSTPPFKRLVFSHLTQTSSEEQMAPSCRTSLQANMPLPFSTPVKIITDVFILLARKQACEQGNLDSDEELMEEDKSLNIPKTLVDTFAQLSESSMHPLFSKKPITSNMQPPSFDTFLMLPVKCHGDLLWLKPQNEHEQLLQAALHNTEIWEAYHKA